MLNKYPYFFIYLYKDANNDYKKYYNKYEIICRHKLGVTLEYILNKENKTEEESKFVNSFYEYMPLIYSKSSMNLVCKYIESKNFEISKKIKINNTNDFYYIYKDSKSNYNDNIYNKVKKVILNYINAKSKEIISQNAEMNSDNNILSNNDGIKEELYKINKNTKIIVNCLIDFFYLERPNSNKDILWYLYGDVIFENVKNNSNKDIKFPFQNENGTIEYMNKKYEWGPISI